MRPSPRPNRTRSGLPRVGRDRTGKDTRARRPSRTEGGTHMDLALLAKLGGGAASILWIIAVILVIAGIVTILRGGLLAGIVLIVIGCLVGPGGYSIFK